MYYVHVDTMNATDGEWQIVAIPAATADKLLALGCLSKVDYRDEPTGYAAVTDDWSGDWIYSGDLMRMVPGAFIAFRGVSRDVRQPTA